MSQPSHRFPSSMRELLKLVEGTEFEEIAKDESKLEQLMLEAMKVSDDPMTREIGEGIAGGSMTWRTIATTSAYQGYLDENLAALRHFDTDGLIDGLRSVKAEAVRQESDEQERRDLDDGEDVWQGLGGNGR